MKYTIIYENKSYQFTINKEISVAQILKELPFKINYPIIACRINNGNRSLRHIILNDDVIELLDIRDSFANMVYMASMSLLYTKAINDIYPQAKVIIANSLSKGLFTLIKNLPVSKKKAIDKITSRMKECIKEKLPFNEKRIYGEEILPYCLKNNYSEAYNLFSSIYKPLPSVFFYELEQTKDYFLHSLVPDTSYLENFELVAYRSGIILRFNHPLSPNEIPPFEEQKSQYRAFSKETRWCQNIGIEYICDLNRAINNKKGKELILLAETYHIQEICEIAKNIIKAKKRIILIAGPSSSGKTSFAKRLEMQLRVLNSHPLYLGTDDYFLDRNQTPLLPNGEKDYESIKAIDLDLFQQNLNDLLLGKTVDLPHYNFIEGYKFFGQNKQKLKDKEPILIEGIHALNPLLTNKIAEKDKYRIYISPLTQLNIDSHKRVSTSDTRLLRRILRDYKTRGYSAEATMKTWKNVRRGEEMYIFPYSDEADYTFNSATIYEIAILKDKLIPLLTAIDKNSPVYGEARRLLLFLSCFASCQDEEIIPSISLLREFIGHSAWVKS